MSLLTGVVLAAMAFQVDSMPPMPMGDQMHDMSDMSGHQMFEAGLGGGWRLTGMAQVFPIGTYGFANEASPLDDSGYYLTQGAAMLNFESPGRALVLRVTPNFEWLTQEDGELTFGGWGEGFIDSRHPHTGLHEIMLSWNLWDTSAGSFSFSGGKGFAPYGTDDPMSRPSVKYPTNHHLSQVLERFTFNVGWFGGPWSVEAGVFGGAEPESSWDFSNAEAFADSWSMRFVRRFGDVRMGQWDWEVSASYADIAEAHHGAEEHDDTGGPPHEHAGVEGEKERTSLFNGAIRFQAPVSEGSTLYALGEYSWSDPEHDEGYWSFLVETAWSSGRHTPYLRFERATRPEYPREDVVAPGFFRYDHDAEAVGATAWSIASVGYGLTLTTGSVSIRPFVEGQFFDVAEERGGRTALEILGDDRFTALTVGARIFLGGDPMRMGMYGVFDPMTRMGR